MPNNPESDPFAAELVARTRDVLAVVDRDGTLTYVSPGAELLLGHPINDLIGRNAFSLVHADDQLDAFEGFVSTSSSPDSRPTPLLLRLQHADGRWISTELIATNHLHDPAVNGLLLVIRDVSNSMRTEASLRESEGRYRLIVELAQEGIFIVDDSGSITYANRAFAGMLATTVTDLLDRPIFDFMDLDARMRAQTFARKNVSSGDAYDFQLKTADGRTLWTRISANPLPLFDGTNSGIVAFVTDVTERKRLEERLAHEARYDALTGVANRHTLFDVLGRALAEGSGCAVLFADVDFFKKVNDTYGHRTGDEILQIAAARITGAARHTDTVARLGGDEFIVVCAPIDTRNQAVDIAARIVASFAEPVRVASQTITVSVSIGIAFGSPTSDADSLLTQADHALYAAKRGGRNRLEIAAAS